MQRELTISLSDETYNSLMKLVGEQNASQFIELVLRPHISQITEEYEVLLPLNNGKKKVYLRSPKISHASVNVEVIEENANA